MVTGNCPPSVTKKKVANSTSRDMEYIRRVTKDILCEYVDDELLKHVEHGTSHIPYVSFEIAQDQDGRIRIRIRARHDPFGQTVHYTEYCYWSWTYIGYEQITNQLFNTLTFEGSPYYWCKTHFKKSMEVAG